MIPFPFDEGCKHVSIAVISTKHNQKQTREKRVLDPGPESIKKEKSWQELKSGTWSQ